MLTFQADRIEPPDHFAFSSPRFSLIGIYWPRTGNTTAPRKPEDAEPSAN
jgi:hypothetical protein